MSLIPSIRCIKFIIEMLLLSCYGRLPHPFERCEMKPSCCGFRECSLDHRDERSIPEVTDCKPCIVTIFNPGIWGDLDFNFSFLPSIPWKYGLLVQSAFGF